MNTVFDDHIGQTMQDINSGPLALTRRHMGTECNVGMILLTECRSSHHASRAPQVLASHHRRRHHRKRLAYFAWEAKRGVGNLGMGWTAGEAMKWKTAIRVRGKKGIAIGARPREEERQRDARRGEPREPQPSKEGVEVARRMVLIRLLRDRDLFGAAGGEGEGLMWPTVDPGGRERGGDAPARE